MGNQIIVSRTKRTIQNSRMSFLLFLVQVLIGFYSRKIFIDYLGTEVLGLNTTLGNILSFMNLAELGIGVAMATSLYKPLHDNDKVTICEIITVQGLLYRRIAYILCFIGVVVMLTLPFFFKNTECGILYVYISFLVFLSGSIFSYLWNYKQILIAADQKSFKLMPWIQGIKYIKIGLQITCLCIIKWGIWGWIIWEFVGNVAITIVINWVLKKEYPWLQSINKQRNILLKKYRHLITKTKQLFVHKIAYFILDQTAPLIIYGYASLTMVTFYSNYMIIIGYTCSLMNVIFDGMGASIGSLVADNNKKHTLNVFWELLTSRIWISSVACIGLYLFLRPFITVWIGEQYLLSEKTVVLMLLTLFVRLSRGVVDSFKDAYQLFGDIWAPAVEAIINLSCSIYFGSLWGLNGILLGSNISLILIIVLWKPFYLFKYGFRISFVKYYFYYFFYLAIIIICTYFSLRIISFNSSHNVVPNIISLIISFLIYLTISFSSFWLFSIGMRNFTNRIIRLLNSIKLIN